LRNHRRCRSKKRFLPAPSPTAHPSDNFRRVWRFRGSFGEPYAVTGGERVTVPYRVGVFVEEASVVLQHPLDFLRGAEAAAGDISRPVEQQVGVHLRAAVLSRTERIPRRILVAPVTPQRSDEARGRVCHPSCVLMHLRVVRGEVRGSREHAARAQARGRVCHPSCVLMHFRVVRGEVRGSREHAARAQAVHAARLPARARCSPAHKPGTPRCESRERGRERERERERERTLRSIT
jgi:hypothetical protein